MERGKHGQHCGKGAEIAREPRWEAGGDPWPVPGGGSDNPGVSQGALGALFALLAPLGPAQITQPPSRDKGSASALGKTGSFPPESLLLSALDVQMLLCPGRSNFNTVTSLDEFLKPLKASSGTSQLLFQFPGHLVASWIFKIFLNSFQPRERAERTKLVLVFPSCVLGHPWR